MRRVKNTSLGVARRAGLVALSIAALLALPRATRADNEFTFGSQWWTQDAPEAKFQEFRVVPRGGFLESFSFADGSGRNALSIYGINALRADQWTGLTWSNGVRWRVDMDHRQTPHTFSQVARSPFTQLRPGVFVLPDTIQRVNQEQPGDYAKTMTDLLAAAPGLDLGFRTEATRTRLRARPAQGWQFEARGTQRMRSGAKPYGASFGFNNAIELVEPIDQRTVDVDAVASFQRDRVTVQASGGVSTFENRVGALRWDNPKRLSDRTTGTAYIQGDGSASGQIDLYPDNQVARGGLALALRLPERTILNATIGLSQTTQDDAWLPYTVNSALLQSSLDSLLGTNTDGKATTLTQDYRLTSRALAGLSGTLRLQHRKYDNRTPEHFFTGRARLDQSWLAAPGKSHPFGNEQLTMGADLDYRVNATATIGGTVEQRKREHTFREVEEDSEIRYGARARVRPFEGVGVNADYQRGDREIDKSDFPGHYKTIEQPGLRRYDVADRVQDRARAGLSWSANDRLELSANYLYQRDDYPRSELGLREARLQAVGGDVSYAPSDRLALTAGGGFEQVEREQRSWESGTGTLSTADSSRWSAALEDRNVYAFVTGEWWAAPERLTLSAGYEISQTDGDYGLLYPDPQGIKVVKAEDLPSTRFRRHEATLAARWRVLADLDIGGRYMFERYEVADFASQNLPFVTQGAGTPDFPLLAADALYLGDVSQDYKAHRIAVLLTRRF